MRVKEKDLVIGQEYWIDSEKTGSGIYVGMFNNSISFYPTFNKNNGWITDDDGTVTLYGTFPEITYEEV